MYLYQEVWSAFEAGNLKSPMTCDSEHVALISVANMLIWLRCLPFLAKLLSLTMKATHYALVYEVKPTGVVIFMHFGITQAPLLEDLDAFWPIHLDEEILILIKGLSSRAICAWNKCK